MADTPGSILRSKREVEKLKIAQVAKGTRISSIYIQAMEADDFASLPSPVHIRGFLRIYAEFLGLDSNDLITKLDPNLQNTTSETTKKLSTNEDKTNEGGVGLRAPILSSESNSNGTAGPITQPLNESIKEIVNNFAIKSDGDNDLSINNHPQTNSNKIFSSIGERFRIQREALGLSLNEVEKHSRVLKRYLESIEAGDFERLPSSVQARGMLSNYAQFLEIDTEEILLLFADGLQAQILERQQSDTRRSIDSNSYKQKKSALSRYMSIDLLFGGSLIILLIIFAVWGTGRVIDLYNAPASDISAASISDIILTPIHTSTVEDPESIQTAVLVTNTPGVDVNQIAEIPVNVQGQVQIYVVILQRTWLRIIVDNKISLEGRVEPGNAYSFNGNNQVEILTGNGAALQIIYNQTDLGVMGEFGQVVNNIYTPSSIIKPTATMTSTPTITPKPSLTPRTTSTPIP